MKKQTLYYCALVGIFVVIWFSGVVVFVLSKIWGVIPLTLLFAISALLSKTGAKYLSEKFGRPEAENTQE